MTYVEALKVVFPLLNARDLSLCMLVCQQWREIAADDYFWKALCTKHWPSICKRPTPFPASYHKLFQMFSKCQRHIVPSPGLSFDDLEFYIDVWVVEVRDTCAEERVIFSEVVPGSVLRGGPKALPPDIYRRVETSSLDHADDYKMIIPVDPKFGIPYPDNHDISFSLLVGRKDTNKVACIVRKMELNDFADIFYVANNADDLNLATPFNPLKSPITPLVYFLFTDESYLWDFDVCGIEVQFCDRSGTEITRSEEEVLWLLGMLDWN